MTAEERKNLAERALAEARRRIETGQNAFRVGVEGEVLRVTEASVHADHGGYVYLAMQTIGAFAHETVAYGGLIF